MKRAVSRAAGLVLPDEESSTPMPPARPTRGRRPPEDFDDIADLEALLAIDENGLEEALRDQPTLFYRISKAYALEVSRRDAAKQALADAEARADLDIRDEAREDEATARRNKDESKIKLTESEVKARVALDGNVVRARDALASRSETLARLTALREAYQQRSYALKDLASLYIANYYTASEHTAGRTIRDRQAEDNRRAMDAARRGGRE